MDRLVQETPGSLHALTRHLISRSLRFTGFGIILCVLLAGCRIWGSDTIKVSIRFDDPISGHPLTNVSVIAGGDKFFWHRIPAGRVENVTLMPGAKDDRQLTLLYTLDGKTKSWEGPKIKAGAGYQIEINIDTAGVVTHRHCILPCNLD